MNVEIDLNEFKEIYKDSLRFKKELMARSNLTEKDILNLDSDEHLLGFECGVQFILELLFKKIGIENLKE